jgi:transcriptional regulator with XRE-family HTH domain
MTQAQLAEKLSIPRQHVSNMERGQRPISMATARKLAALFNVPTGRFVE